ncbi:MAG TPA: RNA polymerase sigma factor [Candidatus Krumholzibacteria bacterium]|nr:RNA polymerase sigma factor [Candidatus Krumholzibacteria bacterium]HPD72433.1 RNA polymerase sigma factor [Candidatus Krumholzibacteria bacterium]HRY40635.1 RNA polymerase sigma factor [Candidatus Krumholzibacteria bacterium]
MPRERPAVEDQGGDHDQRDIARFQRGDAEGFEALMERYRQRAYGLALGFVGNHDDAMDAVQKSFIRIHRSLDRFRAGEPFFPWFYRIVRNTALNQRRDERRHRGDCPLEWVTEPDRLPSPLQVAEAEELRVRLWAAVEALAQDLREVFLLYTFQGLKYREIADVLDIPLGTVMSRLHSARRRIRQHLGEEEVPA